MRLEIYYIDGQTPLDEMEKLGLRILSITTREELDEFDQPNIEKAINGLLIKNYKQNNFFWKNPSKTCTRFQSHREM